MKKRNLLKLAAYALSLSMVLGLTGCGETQTPTTESDAPVAQSSQAVETPAAEPAVSVNLEKLLGEWVLIGVDQGEYIDLPEDAMASSEVKFYKEDGKYKADMFLSEYSETEIYGATVEEQNEKAYADSSSNWRGEFAKRQRDDVLKICRASIEGDLLRITNFIEYEYEDGDGEKQKDSYDWGYIYANKSASNIEELKDSYRYNETVTVSNVKELYNAIGSRKRIILKAGTYNISDLALRDRKNDLLNNSGYYDDEYGEYVEYEITDDTIYMPYLNHISLEAEDGAEVNIVTEDYSVAPLSFENGSDIVLNGLTLGHEVEPGSCSGSVVELRYCNKVSIEKCNLFGSGTYGIEAMETSDVTVTDCDIYECTNGLLDLIGCYGWSFDNCKLRDSVGDTMLCLYNGWKIKFNNCSFTNNVVGEYCSMINCGEYADDIVFNKCTFKGNSYDTFCEGDGPVMKSCVIDD